MTKPTAGKVVEIKSKEDFHEFLKEAGSTLVVIDFYADWCGPCKAISPKIKAFAEAYAGKAFFAKINVDENDEVAVTEGISAMPTFKLYKNGAKVKELTGANPQKLEEMINNEI